MRSRLDPIVVAVVDAIVLSLLVAAVTLGKSIFLGPAGTRIMIVTLTSLAACLALQAFSGSTGVMSFGHPGFAAIGAYTAGILTLPAALQASALPGLPHSLIGWSLSLAPVLIAAALISGGIAAMVGWPLVRLNGSALSIATLAFLMIVNSVIVGAREITRGSQPFYGVPRLTTLGGALMIACLAIFAVRILRDTAAGRAARAQRDDEVGAMSCGIDVRAARLIVFVISGALAGAAGALLALYLGAFAPKDFYFDYGVTIIAMLIVGGVGSTSGAVAGVMFLSLLIEVLRGFESGGVLLGVKVPPLFGLPQAGLALAMIAVIWRRPEGLIGGQELNLLRRLRGTASASVVAVLPQIKPTNLINTDLSKRFGGVKAVSCVSFEAEGGMITGLIGPNGAGKTTLINLMTGQVAPGKGTTCLGDIVLTGLSAHGVSRAGLARTYQNLRVFGDMTVEENILAAAEAQAPSAAEAVRRTEAALQRFDLSGERHRLASALSYGQRRRLEIARALATAPRFLLLDEPAAGMNPAETSDLVERLRSIRAETGTGILIVEHDLSLIMRLCDRVAVLDRGGLIAMGTPEEIGRNELVIAAYLGSRRGQTHVRERPAPAPLPA